MKKRRLSALLSLCIMLTMPSTAFAGNDDSVISRAVTMDTLEWMPDENWGQISTLTEDTNVPQIETDAYDTIANGYCFDLASHTLSVDTIRVRDGVRFITYGDKDGEGNGIITSISGDPIDIQITIHSTLVIEEDVAINSPVTVQAIPTDKQFSLDDGVADIGLLTCRGTINAPITMEENVTLSLDDTAQFGENASIIVKSGANLYIETDSDHVYKEMPIDIFVEEGGTVSVRQPTIFDSLRGEGTIKIGDHASVYGNVETTSYSTYVAGSMYKISIENGHNKDWLLKVIDAYSMNTDNTDVAEGYLPTVQLEGQFDAQKTIAVLNSLDFFVMSLDGTNSDYTITLNGSQMYLNPVISTVIDGKRYYVYRTPETNLEENEIVFTFKGSLPTLEPENPLVEPEDPSVEQPLSPFDDVSTDDWYYDAVQFVLQNGMMNGTGAATFAPNATTTRAMIVTMLNRLENEPNAAVSGFADVPAGQWYTDAVSWAAANNIVNGTGVTTFAPDQAITREQMAAILYRYAQYKGYDVTASNDLSSYTDVSQISAYATTAMQWANAEGLITGDTATTINPLGNATRAEVATILMRFVENIA